MRTEERKKGKRETRGGKGYTPYLERERERERKKFEKGRKERNERGKRIYTVPREIES